MSCGMSGVVRERAAHELNCPEDQLEITSIGGTSYEATGCGQAATYTCADNQTAFGRETVCVRDDPPTPPADQPAAVARTNSATSRETASSGKPSSEPPAGAGGFAFGAQRNVAQEACVGGGHEWTPLGPGKFKCGGVVKPVDLTDASTELWFCKGGLCRIVISGKAEEQIGWTSAAVNLFQALSAKYGEPAQRDVRIPAGCLKEKTRPDCIERGEASLRVTWIWQTGQRIELFVGIPEDAQTPAVQISYTSPRNLSSSEGL